MKRRFSNSASPILIKALIIGFFTIIHVGVSGDLTHDLIIGSRASTGSHVPVPLNLINLHLFVVVVLIQFHLTMGLSTQALKPDSLDSDSRSGSSGLSHTGTESGFSARVESPETRLTGSGFPIRI